MKRLTKLSILTLAIALLIQSHVQAQNATGQLRIKARVRGSKLIVNSQGKQHVLDVRTSIDAAKLYGASVLFATRRQGFLYLVVAVCGSSKLKPDDRQCGAGQECNLLWIKLNAQWQINDIKSARYESCWASVTSNDGYKIEGDTLRLDYSDFREKKEYKLTYDADRPEGGFHIEESAMRDTESG
ncbi:MAG TPA: hypothetical protein VF766_13240 [Pyrinomonadaceae bacterium]